MVTPLQRTTLTISCENPRNAHRKNTSKSKLKKKCSFALFDVLPHQKKKTKKKREKKIRGNFFFAKMSTLVALCGTHVAEVRANAMHVYEGKNSSHSVSTIESADRILAVCGTADGSLFVATEKGYVIYDAPDWEVSRAVPFAWAGDVVCEPTVNAGVMVSDGGSVTEVRQGEHTKFFLREVFALASIGKHEFACATPTHVHVYKNREWSKMRFESPVLDIKWYNDELFVLTRNELTAHDLGTHQHRTIGPNVRKVKMHVLCDALLLMVSEKGYGTVWDVAEELETAYLPHATSFAAVGTHVWMLQDSPVCVAYAPIARPNPIAE